jgi:hypothetical protein
MNEPTHGVTADQSQRPENYHYNGNSPQHIAPLFCVLVKSERMKCGGGTKMHYLCQRVIFTGNSRRLAQAEANEPLPS